MTWSSWVWCSIAAAGACGGGDRPVSSWILRPILPMKRQFKRSVRALTDSSYRLSRGLYLSSLWVRSFGHRDGRRPVVVYQVGKVGSTTVTRALDRAGIPTYHVHHLRPEYLRGVRKTAADR